MNKIIKSIAAFAMGIVAVACSNNDDIAGDNKSLAVEGVPMSITLDAGGQTASRVKIGYWNEETGSKMDWKWESDDVIYAVSKRTGKYAGRLTLTSWPDVNNQNIAVFSTNENEGIKVQTGDELVFWYLGRDVDESNDSFAKADGISMPKFDISKANGSMLELDFSKQPAFQHYGEREIMSASDKITVEEVDGKSVATNNKKKLVMKHHTSFTRAKMFSPDNKIEYYGVNGSGGGTGWNWVYKVEIHNAKKKGTLDLVNEKFTSTETGEVELWNTVDKSTQSLFNWTILPGEQAPEFTVQTWNDVFWEAKLPEIDVPEGMYYVTKNPDERETSKELDKNFMHLMFTPCEIQPYNVTAFPDANTWEHEPYSMFYTGAYCSGNLLFAYDQYKYAYGFQIAKDPQPVGEDNVFASFPFLTSSTMTVPAGTPYEGGHKANNVIYRDVITDADDLNASNWSDFADYGATKGWDKWSYTFNYKYNIGNSYKKNRELWVNFYKATGRGVENEHIYASYAVPTLNNFDYITGRNHIIYAKIEGTEIEGLISFPASDLVNRSYDRSYIASKLGISDMSKIKVNAVGFKSTADAQGRYIKDICNESDMVTVTQDALAKSNFLFLPLNPYGYKDFAGNIQHPEWTGLGVYQTSTINADKKPLAFFLGKEDGKLKAWYQAVEPTDFMYVRLMAANFWWDAEDPTTRMFTKN